MTTAAEEIRRPIGSAPSNEELEQYIPKLQDEAYAARETAEIRWLVANAVLEGYHYYSVDWRQRQVFVNPHNPRGSVRVQIPELETRFRREKGRLQSLLRMFSTRPAVTGNPDIWRLNRFARGAVAYIWHATQFPTLYNTWAGDILMQGTAGIMPYWDEQRLFEGKLEGDVNFATIPGWQLYPFPAGAVNDEQTDGIIWARVVGEEWIRRNLPEAVDEERTSVTTPYHLSAEFQPGVPPAFEGYQVRHCFFKPSRRFPQGEHCITVGRRIYRRFGELRFWLGDQRVIPICVARYLQVPTSWWGASFGYSLSLLNKELNRLMSLLVRRAILKSHAGYLLYPMGQINPEDLKQQAGGAVAWQASPLKEGAKPFWLTPPSSTADSDVMVNRMAQFAEDFSSQHGPTSGTSVGRVESAQALSSLIRQDMVPLEETLRNVDTACKRAYGIAVEIARTRWKAPRVASVSGPIGGPPLSVRIDPKQVPSTRDIEIITSLDMPMDRPTLVSFLTQLATAPFKGGTPLISTEEFRRGLIAAGITIPGVDLMSADEEQAWIENMLMYGDGQTPGQAPDPHPQLEDAETHLQAHKRFAAMPEVRFASEPVRETFARHIFLTAQMLQGNPVPPDFDSSVRFSDSEEIQALIEAATPGGNLLTQIGGVGPEQIQQLAAGLQSG